MLQESDPDPFVTVELALSIAVLALVLFVALLTALAAWLGLLLQRARDRVFQLREWYSDRQRRALVQRELAVRQAERSQVRAKHPPPTPPPLVPPPLPVSELDDTPSAPAPLDWRDSMLLTTAIPKPPKLPKPEE